MACCSFCPKNLDSEKWLKLTCHHSFHLRCFQDTSNNLISNCPVCDLKFNFYFIEKLFQSQIFFPLFAQRATKLACVKSKKANSEKKVKVIDQHKWANLCEIRKAEKFKWEHGYNRWSRYTQTIYFTPEGARSGIVGGANMNESIKLIK